MNVSRYYFNTVIEANIAFDSYKMNHDYNSMLLLLKANYEMLNDAEWKVSELIQNIEIIINLHDGL